jgi:outer membrane receptor protein involved in Fe transport
MSMVFSLRMAAVRGALKSGAACLALGLPGMALAQAAEDPPAAEEASGNEIIVTATKREQTLQDVPVAVSVTSAATLERAQIRDLKDLSSVVPSLRVNTLQSSANTNFYIRGFGNGANNAGIEPSVGLFVDGVYRSRSASMIADLPDVQRIEVLRGPQSTLFGKNASAGVISIVTRKPQFNFGGNVEASYGNYNAIVLKGVVTGPITETIAASLAGGYNKRDGNVKDLGTGDRTNERNRWFVRGQLLFEPDGPLSVRLIGDYGKIDENCCAVVNLRAAAPTSAIFALGGRVNPANDPYSDKVFNNFNSTNKIENYGGSAQVDYDMGAFDIQSITSYRRTNAVTNQDSDFSSADLLGRNFQDLRIKTFTQELRANAEIGEKINVLLGGFYFNEKIAQENELLLGTQFRPYADLLIRGQSANAFNVGLVEQLLGAATGNPGRYIGQFFKSGTGFTEGYRLKNESYSFFGQADFEVTDRLTLTGGIAYTHDKKRFATNSASTEAFSAVPLAALIPNATNVLVAQNVAAALQVPVTQITPAIIQGFATNPQTAAIFQRIQAGSAAAAGQLPALRALQFLPPFLNVPNAVESGRVSDGDLSYTARLSYDVTGTVNVYLGYATGYKAASVNLSRDSRPTPADLPAVNAAGLGLPNLTSGSRFAGPENSTLYEIGIKANWDLASANLAVFKQSIKGFQSNIFTGTGFFLANAGKQSVQGVEFEGMVRPAKPLTLSVAMTYLDGKFDRFLLSAFGDLSGTVPAGFSPLSATFAAEWNQPIGTSNLIARVDYHYEAPFKLVEGLPNLVVKNPITDQVLSVNAALEAAREFKQEINDLNASLTYAMENGLELTVWGRNLLDDRTILQIFDSPAQSGSISGYPNQPRTYGVTARFRW